ncbi:MAG TPA: DUF3090 family protein [Acidimicrobiales bacterium]|jgi:uncharacterized repeat protein (TIGR03847 family)|nr:DUF3090 family protein [Acidimicrobiales bacterium]
MSSSFDLPAVDHLTVGAVGEPGHRTFYLQARQDSQLVTLKIEKQQVRVLSERLLPLVRDVLPTAVPAPDLAEPVLAEWPIGALRVLEDSASGQIVLMAEEIVEVDEEGEPAVTGGLARFGATRAQIAALARRGMELVEAGRPLCPLCGFPLDPEDHACPRTNGNRSPTL